MLEGGRTITYSAGSMEISDGSTEIAIGGDVFYWPPGHTVKAETDAEVIMFSPQGEHNQVIDHVLGKING